MSTHVVSVVARSGNDKTGPIPVTYRPMDTCPSTCPFLPTGETGGCYGTGRIFAHAAKARPVSVADMVDTVRADLWKRARFLRDRVVGDILTPEGAIDHGYVAAVADTARATGVRAFGYTHAWDVMTRDDVARVQDTGYIMNASCETPADVARAIDLGLPVVIANDDVRDGEMIAGKRVVTCPAQTRDGVTCATCGLCARPQRAAVVRFLIHGTAKRRARAAVASKAARAGATA